MKSLVLTTAAALIGLSSLSTAAILAVYLDGNDNFNPSWVDSGISATNMTSNGGEFRTNYGNPGTTPAGRPIDPDNPGSAPAAGSFWRLFPAAATPSTPTAGSSSLSATLTAVDQPFLLSTLSFDLANAIHLTAAESVTTTFTIFVNGVELDPSLISPSPTLTKTGNSGYLVQTFTADLSGLGELSSFNFEIAIADNIAAGNVGNFVQGIHIQGDVIPEPGSTGLLLGSTLALVLHRSRRKTP